MKKTILTLAVLASAAAANAQRMGDVFVYGNVGYNFSRPSNSTTFSAGSTSVTNDDVTKYQSASVSPGIGYQFSDNWGVGINLSYQLNKTDQKSTVSGTPGATTGNTDKTTTFYAGPFIRYTKHMGEHFFVFGQFNASYLHGENTGSTTTGGVTVDNPQTKYNGFDVTINPGVGINVSPCLAIVGSWGSLGYQHYKYSDPSFVPAGTSFDNKYDQFGLDLGRLTLGVQVNFGGHGHMMHKGHHGMMDDTRRMDSNDDENMDGDKKKKKMRKDDDE